MKRFAMIGAGFWARYQLAGWNEVSGAACVAVVDRDPLKAAALAALNGLDRFYTDAAEMMDREKIDFVDIVTNVETHGELVTLAASRGLDAITQKPIAPRLNEAEHLVQSCHNLGTRLFVHENWRWQTPMRELKSIMDSGVIGTVFRAGMDMISGFPVFKNQPFLAELEQFILTDLGSHTLDTARFLFGEASSIYCRTGRVNSTIKGEDVATLILTMGTDEVPVIVRMAYAGNFLERECFPQTLFFVEGSKGSIEIGPDFNIRITTRAGTKTYTVHPPSYSWIDPRYSVVQSSVVPCCQNLLSGLCGGQAETTGEDNLKTLRLVFSAYDSASTNSVISF